jgi:hypothetical protein
VSSSLKWCSFCGVWTPDKTAFHFKIGLLACTAVLFALLGYFMLQEMRANQEKQRQYDRETAIPQ